MSSSQTISSALSDLDASRPSKKIATEFLSQSQYIRVTFEPIGKSSFFLSLENLQIGLKKDISFSRETREDKRKSRQYGYRNALESSLRTRYISEFISLHRNGDGDERKLAAYLDDLRFSLLKGTEFSEKYPDGTKD